MQPIQVLEVTSEDVEFLQAWMPSIVASTVSSDDAHLAEMIENVLGNLEWWRHNPEKCCHLKIVTDGRIVGVILVKNFWNLCILFVEPQYQRRGLGRALVEAAATTCQGKSEKNALWLNAAPDAVHFYTRIGFIDRTPTRTLPPGFQAMMWQL